MFSPDSVFETPLGVRSIELDDQTVLFDVLRDRTLRLNSTASTIWKMLQARPTFEEITEELANKYGIDAEDASLAADEFINELLKMGLIAGSAEQSMRSTT